MNRQNSNLTTLGYKKHVFSGGFLASSYISPVILLAVDCAMLVNLTGNVYVENINILLI